MEYVQVLQGFFSAIRDDPRIGTNHISLYTALFQMWSKQGFRCPLQVFSKELRPFCKIYGSATYHKSIRELHKYGYIWYKPSFNHFEGSFVFFTNGGKKKSLQL
jgi:hypothetical protein